MVDTIIELVSFLGLADTIWYHFSTTYKEVCLVISVHTPPPPNIITSQTSTSSAIAHILMTLNYQQQTKLCTPNM